MKITMIFCWHCTEWLLNNESDFSFAFTELISKSHLSWLMISMTWKWENRNKKTHSKHSVFCFSSLNEFIFRWNSRIHEHFMWFLFFFFGSTKMRKIKQKWLGVSIYASFAFTTNSAVSFNKTILRLSFAVRRQCGKCKIKESLIWFFVLITFSFPFPFVLPPVLFIVESMVCRQGKNEFFHANCPVTFDVKLHGHTKGVQKRIEQSSGYLLLLE